MLSEVYLVLMMYSGNWLSELFFFGLKAFWRLRIEAAFALANSASEVFNYYSPYST
jgi:hypothetical protein